MNEMVQSPTIGDPVQSADVNVEAGESDTIDEQPGNGHTGNGHDLIGPIEVVTSQPEPQQVVLYETMCWAIAEAHAVDEVKEVRDQAIALEVYARQASNTEAEEKARKIRLRAERRVGELLKQMKKAKGGRPKANGGRPTKTGGEERPVSEPTLRDFNITKDQSSDWQKLADVPAQAFEDALDDPTTRPTTAGIIKANQKPKPNPVSKEALWLWGRLCDFERDGLLAKEPGEVLATMTPEMLNDVHTLAPRVARWLKKIGKLP